MTKPKLPSASLILIISGCLLLLISFGLRSSFGLFVQPMGEVRGWGRDIIGFALAIQNLSWGIIAVLAGGLADRFGNAKIIVAGAVLYALGIFATASVTETWALHSTTGLLVGAGVAGTAFGIVLPAMAKVVAPEQRQLVLGIGTAAGSMGQFILVPGIQWFIGDIGWQATLHIMAAIALMMAVLAMPFATRKSANSAGSAFSTSSLSTEPDWVTTARLARRHRPYWLLVMGFFVCGFHVAFITVHMPPFLADQGFAPSIAAWSLGLIGLLNIVGSLGAGWATSRMPMERFLIGLYGGRAIAIALFLWLPMSQLSVLLFSAVMGLLWLATVPPTSGLVAAMFGTRYMATLYGVVFLGHQLGSFIGVWLGGVAYELSGSYLPIWWGAVGLSVVAMLLHLPISAKPALHSFQQQRSS